MNSPTYKDVNIKMLAFKKVDIKNIADPSLDIKHNIFTQQHSILA